MARPLPFRRAQIGPTTLLCIDDQAHYLPVRKAVLESRGFEVFTASSGREGLAILRKHKIDGVVLDYRMPEMDGGEVAGEIRRSWPNLPIVLLSGFPQDIPPQVRALVNAVVIKGRGAPELLRAIEAALPGMTLRPRPAASSKESIQQTRNQIEFIKQMTAERQRAIARRKR
jgi:two-component system cell cycle sensor histidine kinase/response regulator CckA